MNSKQKMRLLLLATLTGLSGTMHAMKMVEAPAAKAAKPIVEQKSPGRNATLSASQKAQQAVLPLGKRMISQAGEALGFNSRNILIEGKTNAIDLNTTQRTLDMKPTTTLAEPANQGIKFNDNVIEAKTNADRNSLLRSAKDKLANTGYALGLSSNRQITTRVKNSSNVETGEIRIDNVNREGNLVDTTLYSKDGKSYTKLNADGTIAEQLTPDGRTITNEYVNGKLTQQREVTPNNLNFSNNKISEVTLFNADGSPKSSTIQTGGKLNRATFIKDFVENNPREYTLKDAKGKAIETRTASKTDSNLYETKDASGKLLKTEKLDAQGQLQELNIFDKSGQPLTTITMENGQPTTVIRDNTGKTLSSVATNSDGTLTVQTTVPETWTLSGGLLGTGKTKTTTSIIENGKMVEKNINLATPERLQNRLSLENSLLKTNSTTIDSAPSIPTPEPLIDNMAPLNSQTGIFTQSATSPTEQASYSPNAVTNATNALYTMANGAPTSAPPAIPTAGTGPTAASTNAYNGNHNFLQGPYSQANSLLGY